MACEINENKVQLTLAQLCDELKFKPETFKEVTGVAVPPPKLKEAEVIPFRNLA